MTSNRHFDDISLSALKKDINGYSWDVFRADAMAGLSVAFLTVPQAMAYSLLAGLPIFCGIFAAIYSAIIAAAFGSSRHLVVGPNNAIAILVQSGTAEILFTYYRDLGDAERCLMAVQILTQLSFLVAILQILAARFKLGRLIQFVSYSVVIGYIAGAMIAVLINQLFVFLGIPQGTGLDSLYEKALYLFTHLYQIKWLTALVGFGALFSLIFLKRLNKTIPAAVITLALASLVVQSIDIFSYSSSIDAAGNFIHPVMIVGDKAEVYSIFPKLTLPFCFDPGILNSLLPVAFAVALLSIMETASVAKSVAANSGQRLCINQEIFGIGLGNLVSSFIGGMPVSGSSSRSAMNFANGALTRFAAILNSIFVALFLFTFSFFVTRIPLSALAALLLFTSISLFNHRQFLICLKATRSDALVLWATLLSCIFFSLDVAFYIGIVISITLYLKKAAIPQLVEYDIDDFGELKNHEFSSTHEKKNIRVIKVEGELFFGAADLFQTTLKSIAKDDKTTRVIILQLKNARDIDATTCLALKQLHDYLKGSNRYLIACGLTDQVWEVLSDSGIVELLGKENLFFFDERSPHLHMQKAFLWAKKLVASHPQEDSFDSVELAYETSSISELHPERVN